MVFDASNPVQDSTRMTINNMRERNQLQKRQNLDYLNNLCVKLETLKLETLPSSDPEGFKAKRVAQLVSQKIEQWKNIINANNDPGNLSPEQLSKFLKLHDPFPVCGLMRDGIPIHPTSVAQTKGLVNTSLTFGGVGIDKEFASMLSSYLETDFLQEILEGLAPYTQGTTSGLQVRLRKQLAQKCKDLEIPYERFKNIMELRMPIKPEVLMDWGGDIYEKVELVKSSYNSTAGAPYWRKKQEAIDDLMEVTLPLVVQKLCEKDGMISLFRENPEMFLSIIKNKDDRYEDCASKTRPYMALPWHFQILFSVLCQNFCSALKTFVDSSSCWNAYGFSFANGGATALAEAALGLQPGQHFCAFYGDDAFVAINIKGTRYVICPDFSQMDGCIDEKTIKFTLKWMYDKFAEQFGENPFWKNVIKLWEFLITEPYFILQGTQIYRKKQKGGLLSGVVGTTLFDTVKSVVAYQALFDLYEQAPSMLLDEEQMVKFFANQGLVIKEGTWKPTIIHEPNVGGYLCELPFLGMTLKKYEFNGTHIYVPTNPLENWLKLSLTPKRSENVKGLYQRARYLFDRLRGSLTSGGVFEDTFRKLCNSVLKNIPPAAIAMEVMAGQGKGSIPELVHTVGDDFVYTSSSGWPTVEWALNLYAPEEFKIHGREKMDEYFIDPNGTLKMPKRQKLVPQALIVDVSSGGQVVSSSVITVDEPDRVPVVEDFTDKLGVAESLEIPSEMTFNKQSKIKDYHPSTGEVLDKKYIPGLDEQIKNIIGPVKTERPVAFEGYHDNIVQLCKNAHKDALVEILKDEDNLDITEQLLLNMALDGASTDLLEEWSYCFYRMMSLYHLSLLLKVPQGTVEYHARRLGYYVFGSPSLSFVSPVPVAPLAPEYFKQIQKQEVENLRNLAQLKENLNQKVIDETTTKKMATKANLQEVVHRAEQRPAMLPPAVEPENPVVKTTPTSLKFKFIPGLDARAALSGGKSVQYQAVKRIYGEAGLRYSLEQDVTTMKFFVFPEDSGIDQLSERCLFFSTDLPRREGYTAFYKETIKKYIRDTELDKKQSLAKYHTDAWDVLTEVEEQVKVTLFKEFGRPILAQISKKPAVLLVNDHKKLKPPTEHKEGFIIEEGNEIKYINFKNCQTNIAKMQRLNRILGTEIEYEQLSYHDFINKYSEFDDRVGASRRLQSLSDKRRKHHNSQKQPPLKGEQLKTALLEAVAKDKIKTQEEKKEKEIAAIKTQKEVEKKVEKPVEPPNKDGKEEQKQQQQQKGRRGKSRGKRWEKRVPKEKEQQHWSEEEKDEPEQIQYEQSSHSEGGGQRVRLFRKYPNHYPRQAWGYQGGYQYMPYSMEWYPYPGRGPIMAEMAPQEPSGRNYHFGQQNDWGNVYSGMGGGPRRGNKFWGGRPRKVYGPKSFKGQNY